MTETIDPALLAEPVRGRNLEADTLGGLLEGPPSLLVFLRHFG